MKVDWELLGGFLKDLFLLLLGLSLARILEKKVKLVAYYEHVSAFRINQNDGKVLDVFTHSLILRNSGKANATNVRIHHNQLTNFQIWPAVVHSVEILPDGSKDIVIPIFIPKEQITISYLYFPPITYDKTNAGIKCDQGFAQQIQVSMQPKAKQWVFVLVWSLIFIGLISSLYLLSIFYSWVLTKLA